MEILTLLVILSVALALFISERLRADLVSMLVLLALALTGLLSPREVFSGFSSPAVITVGAMFVLSAAAERTGIAAFIGQIIKSVAGAREWALLVVIMLTVAMISAFINNVGAVALLLPVVITLAKENQISPSKLLIPLAYGSLMGGVCTLIGTPPNILVSTIVAERGLRPFELFEFTPLGVAIVGAGILYMLFVGRFLLPARQQGSALSDETLKKDYLTELVLPAESKLIGKRLFELRWRDRGIEILEWLRRKRPLLDLAPWVGCMKATCLSSRGRPRRSSN